MTFTRVAVVLLALGMPSVTAGCSNTADSRSVTTTVATVVSPASTGPAGTGLTSIPPQPPDADGNPPCGVGIGWDLYTGPNGSRGVMVDIQKTLVINDFVSLPDHFAVDIDTKDGRHYSQDDYVSEAATGNWDSVAEKDFIFEQIDPFDVEHVVVRSGEGTCWADGNPI
ncbi:hypothetical protein [Mycolicibacterium goodii]|uniref:Lipoprotein n=1 Tax=Mycolicibacterium goodii TaxID=134601 RepID=A0A0K0XCH3_MYCGD|nr:hypothetical protein AFA91_27965 [Mycolicibacterium goodii]